MVEARVDGLCGRRAVLAEAGDERVLADRLTGDRSLISNYLANHVLAALSEDLQEFLLDTSILERFNAELANAVCDRKDAWVALWRLEHLHALLIPMDHEQGWFRLRHLFAECLQALLQRRHPGLIGELYLRASYWFEAQGNVSEAVRYAGLAQDFDRSARLIEAAGGWELILFGGIGYLRSLLAKVPEWELNRYPRLQLAKAYLLLKDGRIPESRGIFDAAIANPKANETDLSFSRDALNVGTLLGTYEDNWLESERYSQLTSLRDSVHPDDGVTLGVLYCQEAVANLGLAYFHDALEASESAMRAMQQGRTALGLNYCYLHAGLAAFYQGRLRLAERYFGVARRMAEENFGADSGLQNAAEVLLAALYYWRGELTEDRQENFLRAFNEIEHNDGWFELYAVGLSVEAGVANDVGDLEKLRSAVARAERISDNRGIHRLADLALAHRLRLLEIEGQIAKARSIACELEAGYGRGCWQTERFRWAPYQQVARSLAQYHMGRQTAKSLAYFDDLIACNEAVGSGTHLVAAYVAKADLERHAGRRTESIALLVRALRLAIVEDIRMPFSSFTLTTSLLLNNAGLAQEASEDKLLQTFVTDCLARRRQRQQRDQVSSIIGFSQREQGVMEELAQGLSNKEIARALDLSENTVKFHLKNIYSKLGVKQRSAAIARVRDLGLSL